MCIKWKLSLFLLGWRGVNTTPSSDSPCQYRYSEEANEGASLNMSTLHQVQNCDRPHWAPPAHGFAIVAWNIWSLRTTSKCRLLAIQYLDYWHPGNKGCQPLWATTLDKPQVNIYTAETSHIPWPMSCAWTKATGPYSQFGICWWLGRNHRHCHTNAQRQHHQLLHRKCIWPKFWQSSRRSFPTWSHSAMNWAQPLTSQPDGRYFCMETSIPVSKT